MPVVPLNPPMPIVPMNPPASPGVTFTPMTSPQIPLQEEEHPLLLITEIPADRRARNQRQRPRETQVARQQVGSGFFCRAGIVLFGHSRCCCNQRARAKLGEFDPCSQNFWRRAFQTATRVSQSRRRPR
jgi:hypothetical protein